MNELFVKKYWPEENNWFYIHFKDGEAVRQIEIKNNANIKLSEEKPVFESSMLYDQRLENLDVEEKDYITADEFEKKWKE